MKKLFAAVILFTMATGCIEGFSKGKQENTEPMILAMVISPYLDKAGFEKVSESFKKFFKELKAKNELQVLEAEGPSVIAVFKMDDENLSDKIKRKRFKNELRQVGDFLAQSKADKGETYDLTNLIEYFSKNRTGDKDVHQEVVIYGYGDVNDDLKNSDKTDSLKNVRFHMIFLSSDLLKEHATKNECCENLCRLVSAKQGALITCEQGAEGLQQRIFDKNLSARNCSSEPVSEDYHPEPDRKEQHPELRKPLPQRFFLKLLWKDEKRKTDFDLAVIRDDERVYFNKEKTSFAEFAGKSPDANQDVNRWEKIRIVEYHSNLIIKIKQDDGPPPPEGKVTIEIRDENTDELLVKKEVSGFDNTAIYHVRNFSAEFPLKNLIETEQLVLDIMPEETPASGEDIKPELSRMNKNQSADVLEKVKVNLSGNEPFTMSTGGEGRISYNLQTDGFVKIAYKHYPEKWAGVVWTSNRKYNLDPHSKILIRFHTPLRQADWKLVLKEAGKDDMEIILPAGKTEYEFRYNEIDIPDWVKARGGVHEKYYGINQVLISTPWKDTNGSIDLKEIIFEARN